MWGQMYETIKQKTVFCFEKQKQKQYPGNGHDRIPKQALRRWHQRNRIPRRPRLPAAGLQQGNLTFFAM